MSPRSPSLLHSRRLFTANSAIVSAVAAAKMPNNKQSLLNTSLRARHGSESNLAARTPLGDFMHDWNRREVVPRWRKTRQCLLFRRAHSQVEQAQHQMPANLVRPPYVPPPRSPFEAPRWHSKRDNKVCPDGDLLPAAWFNIDSEDLSRLHQKLQRRINRRRSLTQANLPFGETNSRRADILQKYERLRGGIRRALSEHQICFMDPKRDVEWEIVARRKASEQSAKWPSDRARHTKRVSFSAPTAVVHEEGGAGGGFARMGGMVEAAMRMVRSGTPRTQAPIVHLEHSSTSFCATPTHPAGVGCGAPIPVKPILATRKLSIGQTTQQSEAPAPGDSPAGGTFRRRINTIGDDEICAMDYATFRAWRRGSRLSIDVLNSAAAAFGTPTAVPNKGVQGKAAARQQPPPKMAPKSNSGTVEKGTGWVQLLKRVLADCLEQHQEQQQQHRRRHRAHTAIGGEEKRPSAALGTPSSRMLCR